MRLRAFCVGVAATSAASIALSLLLTRIFSVTMYYHFAFLLISLALLGIAVSGVAVYLLPRQFREKRLAQAAAGFAIAVAPLALLALAVAVANPMSIDLKHENLLRLTKLYAATALPFLSSGFAITLAIAGAGERIGRVYAFDLGGAAVGCLVVIPLLVHLGGPGAVIAAAGLAAAGGLAFAWSAARPGAAGYALRWVGAATSLGLFALAGVQASSGRPFRIAQTAKFLREDRVVYERWNAFSRVTVSTAPTNDYLWLHIDADAATRMYATSHLAERGWEPLRRFSEYRLAALVYAIRKQGPALVIGPGGGPDLLSALRAGLPRAVGVEVNPIIVEDIMRGRYAAWNGDLYRNPRLEVTVDDGRSFIRRAHEAYSSIQATLVDTWAASTAGAFTLTENNLYTLEAFTEYLAHLEPDGVLSMTRWWAQPPKEFLR